MTRLQGYPNFRDLGGMRAGASCRVRHGRVFRAEAVLDPGSGDAALLEANDIRLVFDLRSSGECERAPNRFLVGLGAECLNMDLLAQLDPASDPWLALREDSTADGADTAMHALYRGLPRAVLPYAPTFLERIADSGAPMLVHCTAGKDRTGFMIALLLAALGTDNEAIFADYMLSASRKTAAAREATRAMIASHLGRDLSNEALDIMMGVKPTYLAASFLAIETQFGGIDHYLSQLGFGTARRASLRVQLLE